MDPEGTSADVQPDAGAAEAALSDPGQGATDFQGLYDLSAAPEELRPLLEAELKKVDANVTQRFMEHAEFKKKLGPLAEIEGLADVPPEDLKELMEFRELAGDEEQFESWWFAVGKELGFFDDDGNPAEPGSNGNGEPAGGLSEEKIAQLVQQAVGPLAERLEQFESQGQSEKAQQAATQEVESQLAALREEHGEFDEKLVRRLARDYVSEPDFIRKGFEDMLRITGQAQSQLVGDKLDQPSPANRGGRPDTTTEPITTFDQAKAAALQRLGG
jgi:hypothetical protein